MAAQFIATKGPLAEALALWIAWATNSLPVPLSPIINTFESLLAAFLLAAIIFFTGKESPIMLSKS